MIRVEASDLGASDSYPVRVLSYANRGIIVGFNKLTSFYHVALTLKEDYPYVPCILVDKYTSVIIPLNGSSERAFKINVYFTGASSRSI